MCDVEKVMQEAIENAMLMPDCLGLIAQWGNVFIDPLSHWAIEP
jgi:hypothetical protein